MRLRVITAVVLAVFLATGVFCAVKRQTYTDITGEDNYMDKLSVGVVLDESIIYICNLLEAKLTDMPIVLKVKCVGEREYLYRVGQQLVYVEEVYRGSELIEEEEIYVYSERWTIIMWSEPNSAENAFINTMEPGEEYLLFLTGNKAEVSGTDIPGYQIYGDIAILPIFLFGEREHTTVELAEDVTNTYVPYSEVKGNEMFAETEEGYEIWLELKEKLFEKYVEGKDIQEEEPPENNVPTGEPPKHEIPEEDLPDENDAFEFLSRYSRWVSMEENIICSIGFTPDNGSFFNEETGKNENYGCYGSTIHETYSGVTTDLGLYTPYFRYQASTKTIYLYDGKLECVDKGKIIYADEHYLVIDFVDDCYSYYSRADSVRLEHPHESVPTSAQEYIGISFYTKPRLRIAKYGEGTISVFQCTYDQEEAAKAEVWELKLAKDCEFKSVVYSVGSKTAEETVLEKSDYESVPAEYADGFFDFNDDGEVCSVVFYGEIE